MRLGGPQSFLLSPSTSATSEGKLRSCTVAAAAICSSERCSCPAIGLQHAAASVVV